MSYTDVSLEYIRLGYKRSADVYTLAHQESVEESRKRYAHGFCFILRVVMGHTNVYTDVIRIKTRD